MDVVVVSLLLLSCISNGVESINGGRPPVITAHPSSQMPYKELENVELPCEASGFPKPQFFWEKDGLQLNMTGLFGMSNNNSGKLTITKPTAATADGVYQCFASNDFGVAVTQKTTLKKADLHTFTTADAKSFSPSIGDKLTLFCTPPISYPAATIYWGKSKLGTKLQSIENTERISLDYDGNLYFSNVLKNDYVDGNQTYVCIAEQLTLRTLVQGNDRIVRQPVDDSDRNITYLPPALMWSSPTTYVAIREQTARMKCIFSGYPTPTVTWKRIKSPLPEKVIYESFGQELVIPRVHVSDAGLYQCTGNNTNTGPFISHNFTLTVEAAPFWIHDEAPKDIDASEDDAVEFDCNAGGSPNPTIVWTINGRPLSEAEQNSRRVISGNKIKFSKVEKNDSQVFQCLASNHHGSIMANAYLFVRAEKPSVLESLPKLTKVPEEKTFTLMCRMDGAPKPVITWRRGPDKKPVPGDRFKILPTGDLEITNPGLEDSGMYHCTGTNKFDNETVHGELVVRRKTLIVQPPRSQSVNVTERVEFTCRADTDPEELSNLNVTWLKNNQPLGGGSTAVVIGDSLVIDRAQVSDSGTYTCRADNLVDTSEASSTLIVKDRPNPPTNIRIIGCLSTRAELSWTAGEDSNDPIVEYVVYYNASYDPPEGYHVGARVNRTSAIVRSLKPWANYTFQVTARNGLGTSDRSAFSNGSCSISPERPHSNPTGVCTRNGNPRELVITWKPLHRSEHNGEGFHYLVRYQRWSDADVGVGENMSEKVYDSKELVVKNQEIYKRYRISVLAVNKIGSAPDRGNSFYYGYSSEGVPTVTPMNFRHDNETLNSTSVTFLWDPVDQSAESINGRFLGYRVFFWRRNFPDDVRTEDKSMNPPAAPCPTDDNGRRHVRSRRSSSDSVTLTTHRLWGGASIVASAVVVNGASTGDRSNSIEFDSPEGVPDMVNTLEVVERGTHHLKIEWTAPLEINGKLTHYYSGCINATGHKNMRHVDALRTTAKFHDLSPNSTYQIFIEAHTSAGPGLKKYVSGTTLPLSGLGPDVPKIEEPELGDTFAVIKWRSSVHTQPKNPGSSFHVEYEIKDTKEVNRSENETQHNWINLTDLDPGKQYHVVVVASNPAGESSRSEPKEFILGKSDEPVLHSAEQNLWWLIILILLILLLLLIILIILCCIRHRRQGKYAVYEKERLHGCNADTTNEEPTFGEYTKSAVPTLQAPQEGSMDSMVKLPESDSNSLAEYEETDPTKFNEDGSFIGQYGGQKKEAALDQNAPFATIV